MTDSHGNIIKLSWPQFIWAAGIIFILGGQFFLLATVVSDVKELKVQLSQKVYTKETVDIFRNEEAAEHMRIWQALATKQDIQYKLEKRPYVVPDQWFPR